MANIDPMTLLVHKIAPNQLDLSLGFSYISLRDQMVRASMVVKALAALKSASLTGPASPTGGVELDVVIFGAGAAGVAAALEAEKQGLSFALIEKSPVIPGGVLASKARRYVSVGMYEWPHLNSKSHSFPVVTPPPLVPVPHSLQLQSTGPLLIGDFAQSFVAAAQPFFQNWQNKANAWQPNTAGQYAFSDAVLANASKDSLAATLSNNFELDLDGTTTLGLLVGNPIGINITLKCRWVIYAVGFEKESRHICSAPQPVYHHRNPPFWESDSFDKNSQCAQKVVIIGSGDGALQDTFRFCVKRSRKTMDPHSAWGVLERIFRRKCFIANLKNISEVSRFLERGKAKLAEAEMYTTGHNMWHAKSDANLRLDIVVRTQIDEWLNDPVYGPLFLAAIQVMLRSPAEPISVTLIRRPIKTGQADACFDKCYLLNRTWAWLLHAVGAYTLLNGTVDYFLPAFWGCGGAVSSMNAFEEQAFPVPAIANPMALQPFDIVILRAGLQKAYELKAQGGASQVGILPKRVTRLDLTRIPPPLRP